MAFLEKFEKGAQKAHSTAFAQATSHKAASGLRAHARIYPSWLQTLFLSPFDITQCAASANPERPESAFRNPIPKAVLQHARGLALFQVLKASFVFSGMAGSGIVIARLPDGPWPAPFCIATSGLGWGLQIGADIIDFVIVNSEDGVKAFSIGGNLTIGGSISATAGPISTGGSVQASFAHPAPMFSYSQSKGLFVGTSLEGPALIERKDANHDFYGSSVPAKDISTCRVPSPEVASRLYGIIEAEGPYETGLPEESYVGRGNHQMVFDPDSH
ncbi:SH3 domain-containing protein [Termitomyces sp. T112]|nr:SH3 domain-containing protein [Termitomyces sp. T112]